MGRLPLFLASMLVCILAVASVTVDPPTVTDSYGNYADQDSNIAFAEVPEGAAYVVDPEAYTYNGLEPFFKAVQDFVGICFYGDDPWDLFLGLFDGSIAFGGELILSLFKWGGGYAVCIVLGIGFIFIFPIVACCFCCCRVCCGKCGGKMVQKRDSKTAGWRCCYVISLFISCTFLGCGMICTYVVNERMTTLFTDITTTVQDNVDDFSRYANNTIDQINYVAYDGFGFTADVMLRDLTNIGPLVGGSVQEAMDQEAGVDEAFTELLKMDPLLLELITGLTAVNTAKANVVSDITALETAMTNVATDIDDTFTSCGGACGSPPNTGGLKSGSNFDPDGLPSFDSELADLNAVYAENITALVLEGKAQFNNISKIVEEESAPVISTIESTVDQFDGVISGALTSVNDMLKLFDTITNLTSFIKDLDTTPLAGTLTLGDIEKYRYIGGVVLTCFILLILILQLVGALLGCIACCFLGDKDRLPTKRTAVGSAGGILLMASVGLVFIFGALIMLLVWLTYLVGAPLQQIACANIKDTNYTVFKQLIDGGDPADGPYNTIIGSQDGYTLGNMVFQDPAVPLTVSGLLTDCDANAPAWEALYISQFFDLEAVLDYKGTIDVDGEIDKISVDLSSLEIIDEDTSTQLTDMSDAITLLDFEGLEDGLGNSTDKLTSHIDELNRIQAVELAAVEASQQQMLDDVVSLNASASKAPNQITTLISSLNSTQTVLQNNGVNIIKNESKIFANRVLRIADQFVSFVNTTILEELGRCKPVSNFYQSVLVNTLCGSIVDSWNGVWFSLGWSLAFMVLGLIFSVKLAKHIRKMKALDDKDGGKSYKSKEVEGEGAGPVPGKGKVHPI
ncbi:prominin-1-like [Watersipora subatra]|uniref:prominin-1-like n=1 Tax=Watersipora subatra TaxID=2589382 RepID=UPI00355B4664